MRSLKQTLVAVSGLVLLVAALGVISDAPANAAKTNDVTVVNTPAEPVPTVVTNTPLPVQGTVNAHITNAIVPISGTVAVSSLPAVGISNTSSTPLFVDTGDSARAGIGAACDANYDGSGVAQCTLATVPVGQILVIETITCGASVATGSAVLPIRLAMGAQPIGGGAPFYVFHRLVLTKTDTLSGLDDYGITTPVRMYVAGGTGVSVNSSITSSAGVGSLACAISGHMAAQ
jgi:hypothetical protein